MIDGKLVYTGFAGCDLLVIQNEKNVGAIGAITIDPVILTGVLMYYPAGENCGRPGNPPVKEVFSNPFDILFVYTKDGERFRHHKLLSITTLDEPEEYKYIQYKAKELTEVIEGPDPRLEL